MTRKIKIILAVSNDLEGDQRLHKMALSLMKNGWEPFLIGRITASSGKIKRPYGTARMKMVFRQGPFFYLFLNLRLLIKLLFIRGNIFVANDLDTLAGVYLAAKIRSKPLVYDSHEYFTEVPELVNRQKIKRIWKFLEKKIQPRLEHVITVNESIANLFREEYHNNISVIRNLPLQQISGKEKGRLPFDSKGGPIIIYQGAVNLGRGIELMCKAMKYLDDFKFLVVGGGDLLNSIKDMVQKDGLSDKIYFTGRVPFESLPWYTNHSHFGISMEQDIGLNYRLSLPNKLFDYMRAGIPVIASDLPEIRKVVEDVDYGIILKDFSPENIAKKIDQIWNDKNLYSYYSQNAINKASEYCWESQEPELFDIYQRALTSVGSG